MPQWFKRLFWEATRLTSFTALLLGWSYRVAGRRHIPPTGAVLLIANHQSFFDPPLIGISAWRHLSFLARKTLFRNRFFAWLIDTLNAVPVDQEGVGKEGIKTVLQQLEAGHAVVVFPEGERTTDGDLRRLKPGISLLIKRVKAPIVPVGIAGAHAAWPRTAKLPCPAPLFLPPAKGTVAVWIGEPLDGNRYANMDREQMLDELYVELQKVQANAERLRRQ